MDARPCPRSPNGCSFAPCESQMSTCIYRHRRLRQPLNCPCFHSSAQALTRCADELLGEQILSVADVLKAWEDTLMGTMASKPRGPHTLTDVAPSSVTAVLMGPTSKLDQETGTCRSSGRAYCAWYRHGTKPRAVRSNICTQPTIHESSRLIIWNFMRNAEVFDYIHIP